MDTPTSNTTREQLLAHAEKLIRTRGCNGFSYRDLAEHVGVKTSSIHYYFPGKDDLLYEAVEAYSARALAAMRGIDTSLPAQAQLDQYLSMMESRACGSGELCLAGMLAAEVNSLPERVRGALQGFFRAHEAWLARVLAEGAAQGTMKFSGTPEAAGRAVFATVQGCILVARLFQQPAALCEAIGALYVECDGKHGGAA
ncbi:MULTISPECIES: TetR/AcrR family transcriptional regulator [Achromobacter]|uniref:HTH-type transcriptional repressor nemR n=1 Tax=Achromobacter aegrifaciens TaxID=1287736 RepID=A0AAD2J3A7_ACHAE|nr:MULTISPECIES: TetR/AcrR family transcriptional regulator [Achromobacter]PTN48627.1 TetR/AcrR family transcriptional regulator [Achromobacter xylosoxidans]MBD9422500.1 TetR/AcrR family transcriptional regulator [Achromobacter sp. ACM04]MBD9475662.1 TetR/AcrR family transcriptional regulator [Achromobacter sp. ACM01]MDQ1759229.1 TetR/AcrR family transcriptional regulator [Achromobacter aegrifaciens]MDR7946105.1 TetR/AcrR family transcriptional regulator [Achromobacter aegrifaciens]